MKFLHSTTARLSLTYLAIIMVMSVAFSFVFYQTTSYQLGQQILPRSFYRRIEPDGFTPHVNSFLRQRIDEGRHSLIVRLIILNAVVLALGSLASYLLARRTLEPIEESMEAQSQFASDASHELKTPLTAIRASNEVALRKPGLT
ncbi:MAG: sensor histidine kinase, partial [Candidatus Saccharimonadales bacterium]